jgi:hypothetical protein
VNAEHIFAFRPYRWRSRYSLGGLEPFRQLSVYNPCLTRGTLLRQTMRICLDGCLRHRSAQANSWMCAELQTEFV